VGLAGVGFGKMPIFILPLTDPDLHFLHYPAMKFG
jgi:hypothetical protein